MVPCFNERKNLWQTAEGVHSKNRHVVKFSTQNQTRCIFLNSKYDTLYFFIQNLTHCISFHFKIWHFMKFLIEKNAFWKNMKTSKICRFHGVNRTKTWFFEWKQFFKIWHVKKLLIQNLARCVLINPKSDGL